MTTTAIDAETMGAHDNPLAMLLRSGHPIIGILPPTSPPLPTAFDNRPSWDNWRKNPAKRFDNRPTWDNWKKKR